MTIKTILRSICSRPFPHATAIFLAAVVCFALISSFNALAADVIQQGPANYVSSSDLLNPQPGTAGFDATKDNYVFYLQPGMGEGPGQTQETRPRPTTPYAPAYTNANSPVTTNKWWSAAGLQWSDGIGGGFAFGRDIQLTRTTALIEDPYYMQFVDFGTSPENNLNAAIQGLRLVNRNSLYVNNSGKLVTFTSTACKESGFDPQWNEVARGPLNPETSPVVTVGLQGVHPLGTSTTPPPNPPYTNVQVESYSDWGVVLSYTDNGNKMRITMASGSPFIWFERVSGSNPFTIWAGSTAPTGLVHAFRNSGPNLGLLVRNFFGPPGAGPDLCESRGAVENDGAYAIYADQGTWTKTALKPGAGQAAMFVNSSATRVAVLAVPSSVKLDDAALKEATSEAVLGRFACREITATQIDYPPIPGSQMQSANEIGGKQLDLGYFQSKALLRYQLRATTTPFILPGCNASGRALQMLTPVQVRFLHPGQESSLDSTYQWHSLTGPLTAFVGNTFVEQTATLGLLSIFPAVLANSSLQNPLKTGQLAVEDVYSTLTKWYYLEELKDPTNPNAHLDSFVRNLGTYDGVGANTYEQKWSTLIETALIADQLSHSKQLQSEDDNSTNQLTGACLCTKKSVVAEQIRDYLVRSLEELVAQWFDIYSAHLFQYFPGWNTIIGFPPGFGSAQSINDHHFHYGYFLRAAALIGRYDPNWLSAYAPAIDQLRQDVANFDRSNTGYPFLRNFDVYEGHNWASGIVDGTDGINQESTSEAVNFDAAMIELGQLEQKPDFVAVGELLYELDVRSAANYWFNVHADLTQPVIPPSPDPNTVDYNGNWPQQFVTFKTPEGKTEHTTVYAINKQGVLQRLSFFGPATSSYFIHFIPMSATGLWQERYPAWLSAAWQQFLLDAKAENLLNKTPFETFFADIQARLPGSTDQSIDGTGLKPALERITNPHVFVDYGTNTMAKYWAYTHHILGQLDDSVVADQPNYAVFVKGGNRTFVGYNPDPKNSAAFAFSERSSGNQLAKFTVAPGAVVSQGTSGNTSFTPMPQGPTGNDNLFQAPGRLFLQTATGTGPLTGTLTDAPGSWLPAGGTFTFPATDDLSRIAPSLSIIPAATGNCSDLDPPGTPGCPSSNPAYGKWVGSFKGNVIGSKPRTSFAIYTDPGVAPGWQQAPGLINITHLLVKYWFDASKAGTSPPDRIEVYVRGSNAGENTFVINGNKFTDYYFGCYGIFPEPSKCEQSIPNGLYGLANPNFIEFQTAMIDNRNPSPPPTYLTPTPFPSFVTCGRIEAYIYGTAGAQSNKIPLPVSTGTDPLLGRSSWVRPPYDGGSCS